MTLDFDQMVTVPAMDVFSEGFVYTPFGGGAPSNQFGIFTELPANFDLIGGEVDVSSRNPTLDVRLADMPGAGVGLLQGDIVVLRSRTFEVIDIQLDGAGAAKLILQEVV